jgi:hypothetical protein
MKRHFALGFTGIMPVFIAESCNGDYVIVYMVEGRLKT